VEKNKFVFLTFAQNVLNFGMLLVVCLIFFTAYFTPAQTVLVRINEFGEAFPESIMLIVLVVFNLVMFSYGVKKFGAGYFWRLNC